MPRDETPRRAIGPKLKARPSEKNEFQESKKGIVRSAIGTAALKALSQ